MKEDVSVCILRKVASASQIIASAIAFTEVLTYLKRNRNDN